MRPLVPSVDLVIANEEDLQSVLGIDVRGADVTAAALDARRPIATPRRAWRASSASPQVAMTLRESLSASDNALERGALRRVHAPVLSEPALRRASRGSHRRRRQLRRRSDLRVRVRARSRRRRCASRWRPARSSRRSPGISIACRLPKSNASWRATRAGAFNGSGPRVCVSSPRGAGHEDVRMGHRPRRVSRPAGRRPPPRTIAPACRARSLTKAAARCQAPRSRCATTPPASPSTRTTNREGRYVFDFVDPGTYTVIAELQGFKSVEQKNVAVQQRGDVTVDLALAIGTLEERVVVEVAPVTVQFNSSSKDFTLGRELIDQVPINGRNPYNLATLDPTMFNTPGTTEQENRPYHHAFANDYDAGGGTRRANEVLLDGVPLGASFKTAYTPSMDAVEEITISKNSVDAENGHSLGGVISLNMKAGTNSFRGSAYRVRAQSVAERHRRPHRGAPGRRQRDQPARDEAGDVRRDDRRPDRQEQDVLLHVDRAVGRQQAADDRPHAAERARAARRLQPVRCRAAGCGTSSTRSRRWWTRPRGAWCGRRLPATSSRRSRFDPVALKLLQSLPLPNLPGSVDNWQGSVTEKVDYWNVSQRVDVNITDKFKVFARYGQFQREPVSEQPHRRRPVPAVRQQPLRYEPRRRRRLRDVRQDHPQRPRQLLQHDRRVLQPGVAAR